MEKLNKKEFLNTIQKYETKFFYTGYTSIEKEDEQKKFVKEFINEHQQIKTINGRTAKIANNHRVKFSDGSMLDFDQIGKNDFFKDKNFLIFKHTTISNNFDGVKVQFLLYKICK